MTVPLYSIKDKIEANKSLAYIDYVLEFNKNEAYFQVKQNFMSIGSEIGKENFINFYVGVSGEYYHNIEKNIRVLEGWRILGVLLS